jgi:hypothetical protein
MKNTWKKIVVVIALLGASSLSSVRGAVSVYAEETEPSSNATVATAETATDTNAPATTHHRVRSDEDHPPVRIDETGVHVGGPNPVDINVPDFKHSHLSRDVTGIIAILSTFGMPVMIILVVFYFKHRRNKMAHETLRAMIEKGVPMTPELVAEVRGQGCGISGEKRTRSRLTPGLILTGLGLALLMGEHRYDNRGGWILVFMGVAFLIVWFVEGRSQNNGQTPR